MLLYNILTAGERERRLTWLDLSRTGTFGLIFQNITYAVTIPVYLIIHLLTSPISSPDPTTDAVSVDAQDLFLLPFSVSGAFVVPTIMMALPSPARVAPAAHYTWLALWQVFPAAQSVYHGLFRRATAPIHFRRDAAGEQMDDLYRLLAALSFVPHATLLAVAATPARLVVPHALAAWLPMAGFADKKIFEHISFARAFVPHWPWDSPRVTAAALGARVVRVQGLTALVKMFLQWDLYVGGLAVLVWAVFVYAVARPENKGWVLARVLPRVVVWTALGGPVGAATMLLWERDALLRARQRPVVPPKP